MRGQNVLVSCYRMPNREEFPAHVTCSQWSNLRLWDTRGPGCALTMGCSWIIQAWYDPPGREAWLSRKPRVPGDTGGNGAERLLAAYTCWLNCCWRGQTVKGFCHPRTQGTVNIYSVVGQPEDQSHFSLIALRHRREAIQVSRGSTGLKNRWQQCRCCEVAVAVITQHCVMNELASCFSCSVTDAGGVELRPQTCDGRAVSYQWGQLLCSFSWMGCFCSLCCGKLPRSQVYVWEQEAAGNLIAVWL